MSKAKASTKTKATLKTTSKTAAAEVPKHQFAVLPYRLAETGAPEFLLIVSRETRRWVIPKGWPMKGRKPHEAAAREAWEEAGIIGMPSSTPIGTYAYDKRLKPGHSIPCEVTVFPFAFLEQRRRWPERKERGEGSWHGVEEAATAVGEPGLSQIIRDFGTSLQPEAEAVTPR